MRFTLSLTLLLIYSITQAQVTDKGLERFLSEEDSVSGVSYIKMMPEYEKDMDLKKGVAIEVYSGTYDASPASKASLKYAKQIIEDEKRITKDITYESLVIGNEGEFKSKQDQIEKMVKIVDLPGGVVHQKLSDTKSGREPNALISFRWKWTLIRAAVSGGGTYFGLVYALHLPQSIAMAASVLPAIASGGLSYFNGRFGKYLTNGSWMKWIYDSPSKTAKNFRKIIGLSENRLTNQKSLYTHYFKSKYPELYKNNPDLFNKFVNKKMRTLKLKDLLKMDGLIKWYWTEGLFLLFLRVPQVALSIKPFAGLGVELGQLSFDSLKGMGVQAGGDLGIQTRKEQKFAELEKALRTRKIEAKNAQQALEDLKLLNDPNVNFQISGKSHKLLREIEEWSLKRLTALSGISVAIMNASMLDVPFADSMLVAVGASGGVYYAKVAGVTVEKLKQVGRNIAKKAKVIISKDSGRKVLNFLKSPIQLPYRSIKKRWCQSPFMPFKI